MYLLQKFSINFLKALQQDPAAGQLLAGQIRIQITDTEEALLQRGFFLCVCLHQTQQLFGLPKASGGLGNRFPAAARNLPPGKP